MKDDRRGALHPARLVIAAKSAEGEIVLSAPCPGVWRGAPGRGEVVRPGDPVGELEVLGTLLPLVAPTTMEEGRVIRTHANRAETPVGYGDPLLALDPRATGHATASTESDAVTAQDDNSLVLRAPSSGRFYARPGPGKPPFVQIGEVIETGRTVALLEVMKTFSRVNYGGPGMPARARIVSMLVAEDADLSEGDALFSLEPAQ